MRIAYVISSLSTGGSERSVVEMVDRLRGRGIELEFVVLYERSQGWEQEVREAGWRVQVLPETSWLGRVRALRNYLQSRRPALVHTALFESDLVGRVAGIGKGIPVLSSLVNTSYAPIRFEDPNIRRWKLRFAQMVDRLTARHLTDHFHAVTEAVKVAAVRDLRLEPEKVTVIPRGRDRERLGHPGNDRRRAARAREGIPDDAEVLINVGRQQFQKGQRYCLEAAERVFERRRQARLVIVGPVGQETDFLRRRISASPTLRSKVHLLDQRDDVPDLLAMSDVFVFPSLYEGIGGAVIEAMGLGLPIVASDIPAMREITEPGRNSLLVPPQDSGALASAVSCLLANGELRRSFATRSLSLFEERFRLGAVVDRTVDLYRSIVGADASLVGGSRLAE